MRYFGLILLLVLPIAGCRSRAELAKALAESKAAEAQKDSLLSEVLETTQFVSDLNSELAKAKAVTNASEGTDRGVPGAQQDHQERKATLAKIQQVIARLNESETKLIETENRVKSAKIRNARLLAQIATYKQTIEDLKTAAEQQRAENMAIIANLTGQVDELNVQTASLRIPSSTSRPTRTGCTTPSAPRMSSCRTGWLPRRERSFSSLEEPGWSRRVS